MDVSKSSVLFAISPYLKAKNKEDIAPTPQNGTGTIIRANDRMGNGCFFIAQYGPK